MRELSFVIAIIAGLSLLAAAVAWFRIVRNPKNDLTKGGGGQPPTSRANWASRLIAIALGLSGLAVIVAVISWFLRILQV